LYIVLAGLTLGISGLFQPIPVIVTGSAMGLFFFYSMLKKRPKWDILLVGSTAALFLSPWLLSYLPGMMGAEAYTRMNPVDLPYWLIPLAIGQASFLAILGLYIIDERKNEILSRTESVVNLHGIVLLILIVLSNVSSITSQDVVLFGEYFLRQHRYWFLLYPIIALYAVEGFTEILERTQAKAPLRQKPLTITLFAVLIGAGVLSPIITSNAVAQTISTSPYIAEFKDDHESLMSILARNISRGDVAATPVTENKTSEEATLPSDITCFTGVYIVYDPFYRYTNTDNSTPSQDERKNDLEVLYNNTESLTARLYVINKYNITHIISLNNIELPQDLVLRKQECTFLNQTYVLCVLANSREKLNNK
jgi:hypothetical protein